MAHVGAPVLRTPRATRTLRVTPGVAFAVVWAISTVVFATRAIAGQRTLGGESVILLALGLVFAATLIWHSGFFFHTSARRHGRRVAVIAFFTLALSIAASYLAGKIVPVYGVVLPIAAGAAVTCFFVSDVLTRRHVMYAFGLMAIAAGFATGLQHVTRTTGISTAGWAASQIPLVFFCFLAGWGLQRKAGLDAEGVGEVTLLKRGPRQAVRAALLGALLGLPIGLLGVAVGTTTEDYWVTQPWQFLIALAPGIGEEAWARVFPIPLLYLAFSRIAPPRAGLLAAMLVVVTWFAWLHQWGDITITGWVSTLLAAVIFNLPATWIWLRRGLEASIAAHFTMDGIRFLFAYLFSAGLLPLR